MMLIYLTSQLLSTMSKSTEVEYTKTSDQLPDLHSKNPLTFANHSAPEVKPLQYRETYIQLPNQPDVLIAYNALLYTTCTLSSTVLNQKKTRSTKFNVATVLDSENGFVLIHNDYGNSNDHEEEEEEKKPKILCDK